MHIIETAAKPSVPQALLVGCGNIGGALLKLWSSFGIFSKMVVVQPSLASTEDFAHYDSIKFVSDVKNIPGDFIPAVVVLAIKPQMAEAVIPSLCPHIGETLIVSTLAGTSLDKLAALTSEDCRPVAKPTMLEDFLEVYGTQDRSVLDVREDPSTGTTTKRLNKGRLCDRSSRIVRIMPTVAIKTSRSVNLAFANENISATDIETVEKIIGLSGEITWVREENHLDILTPISGSGPAYFFLLAEILVEETVKLGIDEDTARHIIQGTFIGSASLVSDNVDFAALRKSVTSKGGVTEAALKIMSSGMRNVMEESLKAAMKRLEELRK
ncbi:pyrroline-5-carboxylate reductase [Alphaproteobacteria bacterium]|nr:pyrroline-5-carboxylate reductase [Alphaproteobacteria bacterium]